MATEFDFSGVGSSLDLDPTTSSATSESANLLLGLSSGSAGFPPCQNLGTFGPAGSTETTYDNNAAFALDRTFPGAGHRAMFQQCRGS